MIDGHQFAKAVYDEVQTIKEKRTMSKIMLVTAFVCVGAILLIVGVEYANATCFPFNGTWYCW